MSTDYEKFAHGVQTAIAFDPNPTQLEPKHLRVGIDMSKADMSKADMKGLVELLIAKGVFTQQEYTDAITKSAAEELEFQRDRLAAKIGVDPSNLDLL